MTKDLTQNEDPIYTMLAANKNAIKSVLPKHLTPERVLRVAYMAINKTPKLRECTPASLTNAIIELSILGLELGRTGHIVPYKRDAVFIPDYKGYIELAHRSSMIASLPFKPVYANDYFEYEEGTTRYIKHRPTDGERGKLIAAYAICFFKGGGYDFEVVRQPDIDAVKKQSAGAKYPDSPWNKDDQEWTMWCKTAVRRLAKRIPQSPELQRAAYQEELAEAGVKQDLNYVQDPIDITPLTKADEISKTINQEPDDLVQKGHTWTDKTRKQFHAMMEEQGMGETDKHEFKQWCLDLQKTDHWTEDLCQRAIGKFEELLSRWIDSKNSEVTNEN